MGAAHRGLYICVIGDILREHTYITFLPGIVLTRRVISKTKKTEIALDGCDIEPNFIKITIQTL